MYWSCCVSFPPIMTGYVADLSWKSGARAIEKLDRLRSTMAVNVLSAPWSSVWKTLLGTLLQVLTVIHKCVIEVPSPRLIRHSGYATWAYVTVSSIIRTHTHTHTHTYSHKYSLLHCLLFLCLYCKQNILLPTDVYTHSVTLRYSGRDN